MADIFLNQFRRTFPDEALLPIPVEMFVEQFLGWQFSICDLRVSYGVDALGLCDFSRKEIAIDESLDPGEHPEMAGRYRFTVAHEVSHAHLHSDYYDLYGTQLFERPIVLRSEPRVCPFEFQANTFGANFLMPRRDVEARWLDLGFGRRRRCEQDLDRQRDLCFVEPWDVMLASQFGVSCQAMRIRLRELSLVYRDPETSDERRFAMPEARLESVWQKLRLGPIPQREQLLDARYKNIAINEHWDRRLAKKFGVSARAVRDRLRELGFTYAASGNVNR